MLCPKCKAQVPEDAVFCSQCGKKIVTARRAKPKTRGNGTGCVYYRKDRKCWVAQVTDGYKETPASGTTKEESEKQRVPKKRTKGGFKRKDEALAYIHELKNTKNKIIEKTLKELYELWKPWYSPRVDKETFGCYRAAFNHFSKLHEKKITEINAGDLQECMDNCPRGHRTHQNMKVTAGLLWAYAIDNNYAEKDITNNLYTGKGQSVQREPLSDIEVEKFRREIGKDKYAAYVYALCYLGYRPGEMLEIKKDQVREHEGKLYIIEGKKTDAGRDRIVPIHKKIVPIIRDQLKTEGTEYLFPMYMMSRKGEFKGYKEMSDDYFNKHAFRPLADRLGIPKNKVPYSARHTFSDKLKNAEGTDKVKASLIGHSDYKFTQKKYQSDSIDELFTAMESIK